MRQRLFRAVEILRGEPRTPDLGTQLEDLLLEVWRQEDFERRHPFTCAVIRQESRPRIHDQPAKPVGADAPRLGSADTE